MVVIMKGTKISIISDTHLLPERLVANNETFRKHIKTDRKLLIESEGLLNSALDMIRKKDSKILFVTGDMTKDGEKISHLVFRDKISKFLDEKKDRRIFLIPGNHDINNKYAYNYNVDGKAVAEPIESVTPPEFIKIYKDIIYDKAFDLFKDSKYFKTYLEKVNGLYDRKTPYKSYAHGYTSYASRMDLSDDKKGYEGLTVIGLDTNKYSIEMVMEKEDACQNTEGIITVEELRWICDIAEDAHKRNDIIVLLSHHAFLPHFNNQEKALAPYIIDNHNQIIKDYDMRINGKTPADILADMGIKFVFTGHMHAQDIAKKVSPNNNPIYDIETGSTVTYPLPIRHLTLANNIHSYDPRVSLKVETELINEFEYLGPEGKDYIRVKDALKHASQELITADLIEGLFAEYVLPNNKLDSRDIFQFALDIKINQIDYFDYISKRFLKKIHRKDQKITLRKKKTYKLFLSLEKDFSSSSKDNSFIFTIKSLGQTFSYKIKKIEFNLFINEILDQVDTNVIKNYRLLLSWIKRLADSFLKAKLTEEGSIKTISDLANEAYSLHITGDEKPSEDLRKILREYSDKNILKKAFISMRKDLQNAIDDLLNHVRYDGLIEKYLVRFTDNNKFFGGAVDRRIYKFFGASLSDFFKSLKLKPSKIFDIAINHERLNHLSLIKSKELINLAYNLSTEEQTEYKDFAYFEDNNTFIEESLINYSRNDKDLYKLDPHYPCCSTDTASKALMYADILTIGTLLFIHIRKKNWK